MYTFNLLPLDSTLNNKSNTDLDESRRLNVENCSINELKAQIAQRISLPNDSFGRFEIFRLLLLIDPYRCLLSRCSIDWR